MEKEIIYHACRCAFSCGTDKIPWYMVLHALREGLGIKGNYALGPKDYEAWPQLRELMDYLKQV